MLEGNIDNIGKYPGDPSKIKGIVFSDLDGTILNNSVSAIPESALSAIEKLKANGYKMVISTGRDMDTHYSRRYVGMINANAIIHSNGNKITIEGELKFRHYMDDDLVRRLYEFCKANGYCIGSSIGNEDFFLFPEKKYNAEKSYKNIVLRNFVPFEEYFKRDLRILAMSYAGDLKVEKDIVEAAFPEVQLFPFAGNSGADVVQRGYSKAEGLKKVCAYYGVAHENTYAIGDSSNDAAILKAAGTGIAMGNADDAAKEAADYITDRIDNDGFYKAMEHYGLI